MSECLISRHGGKYRIGKTITDENMSIYQKAGNIVWGPSAFENCSHVKADSHYFYCTRINALAVGKCAFMCIDPESGNIVWNFTYNSYSEMDLKSTTSGNLILIGFCGNNVSGASITCCDTNGNLKWNYSDGEYAITVQGCCLDDNGNAYVALDNGYLVKINSSGELEWKISKPSGNSKTVIAKNYLYCITQYDNMITISRYNLFGDIENLNYFSFSSTSSLQNVTINLDMTCLYISSGKIYAIDITNSTGAIIYTLNTTDCYGIAYKNGFLYLSGNLEKYNAITGQQLWSIPYTSIPNNSYAIRDLAVNDEGYILGIVDAGSNSKLFLSISKYIYIIDN